MRLELIRKLAEMLNGVDLSKVNEGDFVDLPLREARFLIAEGWAVAVEDSKSVEPATRQSNDTVVVDRHRLPVE